MQISPLDIAVSSFEEEMKCSPGTNNYCTYVSGHTSQGSDYFLMNIAQTNTIILKSLIPNEFNM